MGGRRLHVVHLLIRRRSRGQVRFLVYPHEKWKHLTLPTKKSVEEHLEPYIHGTSLEKFVDAIMQADLGVKEDDYAVEQELEPAYETLTSPTARERTSYTIYPVDVWVRPSRRAALCRRVKGEWLTWEEAIERPDVSPTAKAVFKRIQKEQRRLARQPQAKPKEEPKAKPEKKPQWTPLLEAVSDRPSMDALAMKWFSKNKAGVRHLPGETLSEILDAGDRAFNLRVADPYLRYQMQGVGYTWSFFSDKDKQDIHVHGAPVVEIYGILEGKMGIWWKPFWDRGTSAWQHETVKKGGWVEVDSLQCHIVHWIGKGKGVVFKAGPGPLAGVGKIGVEGKTSCEKCPYSCMKPKKVLNLERRLSRKPRKPKGKSGGKKG